MLFWNQIKKYLLVSELAARVRNKRANKGLREAARELGNVRPSTISQVENGKTPDMDTFLALCNWLGVSPSELIDEIKDPPTDADILRNWILLNENLPPDVAKALASLINDRPPTGTAQPNTGIC